MHIALREWQRTSLLTDALLVVAGSLFVAALAQVSLPLPFTPVPITGQSFAVLLVGAVLGARRGATSLALYLLEGSLGLPVFANGTSGWARLLGPTGGYLIGFVAAAWIVGYLTERGLSRHWYMLLLTFLAGEAAIYLLGVPWLALFIGADRALIGGLYPFLPGDALKALLAAIVLPSVRTAVRYWGSE